MDTDTAQTSEFSMRSVDRVCDLLDALADHPEGVALVDIAGTTGLPRSSAFRYLSALESRHYAERATDGATYTLGAAFRRQFSVDVERLADVARPHLERLRDELGETTNLGWLDGTRIRHAVVCEAREMMRLAAQVGDRNYIHSTAMGKAIAAGLPDDRVRALIRAVGMPSVTDATITDIGAFLADLAHVRRVGYGIDDSENQLSGRCVAVRIDGVAVPAAVSVSAPEIRLAAEDVPKVAEKLRLVAERIADRMQQLR